jgi:hypothetical protein
MKTKAPMLFVMAVLVVGMAWQSAGVNAALGVSNSKSPASGIDTGALNDTADNQNVEEGLEGAASGSDDGGLIGIAISSGQAVVNIIAVVAMLPIVLDNMGMMGAWAVPLGLLGQLIAFVGIAQFVSNRDLR